MISEFETDLDEFFKQGHDLLDKRSWNDAFYKYIDSTLLMTQSCWS